MDAIIHQIYINILCDYQVWKVVSRLAQDQTQNWSCNLARLEVQDLQNSKIGKKHGFLKFLEKEMSNLFLCVFNFPRPAQIIDCVIKKYRNGRIINYLLVSQQNVLYLYFVIYTQKMLNFHGLASLARREKGKILPTLMITD